MPPPEADPGAWLERAEADLRVAGLVLDAPGVARWPAGFHLQQAAEKALKALLVCHGVAVPKTHDLAFLAESARGMHPDFTDWSERLAPLAEFAVAQRYPGVVTPNVDLRALLEDVRTVIAEVRVAARAP